MTDKIGTDLPLIDKTPGSPFSEIGFTGLEIYSGVVQQEFLRELRISGRQGGYNRYDEMRRNSPVIGALLRSIQLAVMTVDWAVVSDEGKDDPRVEFINESLAGMEFNFKNHVDDALTMLPFGFALTEIVYKRDNGRIVWDKFAFRGQDTVFQWITTPKGDILGFKQQTSKHLVDEPLPIDKLIHYRTSTERNDPEGKSIIRNSYTSYYYAKNIQVIEAIGIERDLAGIPVIEMPEGSDAKDGAPDFEKAKKIVRRIRNDEQAGVVLPPGWTMKLLSAEGSRLFDTSAIIGRYEKRMLMSGLAQFIMLGMDNVGTQSLSEDQSGFFNSGVNSIATNISDTFTKQAIKRLLELNGMDSEGVWMEHSPAGDTDLEMLTKALQQAGGLITWTPQDEVWLRSVFTLPEKTVEQIEEAQEEERENNLSFLGNIPPAGKPDDKDEMGVETFAADNSPDDNKRKRQESKWRGAFKRFFKSQKGRITEGLEDV